MIYPYHNVRALHIELTDRCNAACPMCPRYDQYGRLTAQVTNTQLYLEDIQAILPIEFVRHQLDRINFCGNYGDPIVARDLIPIIKWVRSLRPRCRIEVNTNGSARREDWWAELGSLLGPDEALGGVWWGLDGLGDTNHLYRRHTDWELIMRNVKAYIGAGGVAQWNFIAFQHNEHQIDEARALAKELGFNRFNLKLTGRFTYSDKYPVMDDGRFQYNLEPSKDERNERPPPPEREHRERTPQTVLAELRAKGILDENNQPTGTQKKKTPAFPIIQSKPVKQIKCMAAKERCVYLSAQGKIYPCCWIANADDVDNQVNMDPNAIDPRQHHLQTIVEGDEFQSVEDSWADNSIQRCVDFCGTDETTEVQGKMKHGPDYVVHEKL